MKIVSLLSSWNAFYVMKSIMTSPKILPQNINHWFSIYILTFFKNIKIYRWYESMCNCFKYQRLLT